MCVGGPGRPNIYNTYNMLLCEVIRGGSFAKCFKFYFNMYALKTNDMGSFNIYVRSMTMQENELVWSLSKVQTRKNEWKEGRFSISRGEQYQIIFEGVRY